MTELVIDTWHTKETCQTTYTVMPDGCRDIIYRHLEGMRPEWCVSPLFDTATVIESSETMTMVGFRLKAGVKIDHVKLLRSLRNLPPENEVIANIGRDIITQPEFVEEALDLFAACPMNVDNAAKELGVSVRTLQRQVLLATERTPVYWLNLSRVRNCAKAIDTQKPLNELAIDCGFADQSHMNREFRRWFNATPAEFREHADLKSLVEMSGYGDD